MLLGVDVSHWQGVVDWVQVKAAGYTFVFCKATEGLFYIDGSFARFAKDAKAAGLKVGAYHFHQPTVDGVAQAKHFHEIAGQVDLDLPPVIDIEVWDPKFNLINHRQDLIENVRQCLEVTEHLFKQTPIVYTRGNHWDNAIGVVGWEQKYPLWIAHYTTGTVPTLPKAWKTWLYWQYTDKAIVAGVVAPVDADKYQGNGQDVVINMYRVGDWIFGRLPDGSVTIAKKGLGATDPVTAGCNISKEDWKKVAETLG